MSGGRTPNQPERRAYLAQLLDIQSGKVDHFWFGPDDEKYPISEFESRHGCTVEDVIAIVRCWISKAEEQEGKTSAKSEYFKSSRNMILDEGGNDAQGVHHPNQPTAWSQFLELIGWGKR